MNEPVFLDVEKSIFEDNDAIAMGIRERLAKNGTLMLNVMASPGAGKTTLIQALLKRMTPKYSFAVIEGDIESRMDSEKIAGLGVKTAQIRTGGSCHLDAGMISAAIDSLEDAACDVLIVENIGNLVCPAEFDIGAGLSITVLSVPEGDDKPVKYPLMYSVCDMMIVSKCDTLPMFDFDIELAKKRAARLNPKLQVFPVSAKTSEGMDELIDAIEAEIELARERKA